jgi:predicted nucleic acid-binding protein
VWADWSQQQLDAAGLRTALCINPVIYAELSIAFARIEELEAVIEEGDLSMVETPREALFLAGKVFVQYRRRRGAARTGVSPDFFIGAHAAVSSMPLLTRDAARYASYFPTVDLINPP